MKLIFALLLGTLGLAFGIPAEAQTWPEKSLRAIVPVAAGSIADILSRVVFEQLSQQLGQTIIVENRSGAGGTIAAAFVANSNADGYTFLVHSVAHTIAPSLYPNLSYDPARDFLRLFPSAFRRTSWSSRRQRASRKSQTSSQRPRQTRAP